MSCWEDVGRYLATDTFWMADPRIRRRIGKLVAGDPDVGYPITWLLRRMKHELPYDRVLSIGCGTGPAERHLIAEGASNRITAIDVSANAIAHARGAAAETGFGDRVRYEVADAHAFLAGNGTWNAVFFHASLHHLDRLPELFALIDAKLEPGGVLYFDEYIGPSRDEWNWMRMAVPNLLYFSLPRSVRRTRIIRPPVTAEDPTEQIRASQIAPLVRERFAILEWRNYGGNFLSLIYPSLRRPTAGDVAAERADARALDRLFRAEDFLLRHPRLPGARSFHAAVIARKR